MCFTALALGASVAGSAIQASAAKKATNAQAAAASNDLALKERIYEEQKALFQPSYDSGLKAGGVLNYLAGIADKPEDYQGFTATPGYDFRLSQGQKAIDNSAASRGTLYSGNTLKALSDYGQNTGAAEFGNHLNLLGSIASSGQAAAAGQQAAGNAYSQGAGNAFANMGNAAAAGSIATGNAWAGGINNAISGIGYQNALNRNNGVTANVFSTPWASGGFWG